MEFKKIEVLEFCEDGSFWGSTQYSMLTEMDKMALTTLNSVKRINVSAAIGDMCLVMCSIRGEEKWVRAKVCSVLSSREFLKLLELFLVDYGIVCGQPLDKVYELPVALSEYPPLALKYFLKDIQPSLVGGLSWAAEVKKILQKFCCSERMLVDAVISGNDLAILYLESTVTGELLDFNEHLRLLGLAKIPVPSSEVEIVTEVVEKSATRCCEEISDSACTSKIRKTAQKNSMVFVQSSEYFDPVTLETSSVPLSLIGELRNIGMSSLTAIQSFSVPYVKSGKNTVIVSPATSGKTLSYLLPLMANIVPDYGLTEPRLIILVASSQQARSVELQVLKFVSWKADSRIRVACAYYACEVEAYYQLINGVDVLITTPSSALRLHDKMSGIFNEITCLVLDDYNLTCQLFSDEWSQLTQIVGIAKHQIVAAGKIWSDNMSELLNVLMDPVVVISCPIEASIKSKVHFNVRPVSEIVKESLLSLAASGESMLICTSSEEEACDIFMTLQLHSLFPELLTKSNIHSFDSGSKKIAILSDELLLSASTLNLQYHHVFHYSPPADKLIFRLRLSVLYPSMLKNLQCICTFAGVQKWSFQSLVLEDLISRSGATPIQYITEIAADIKEAKEALYFQKGHDFCYDLKAWGTCRNKTCCSLHKSGIKKETIFDSQDLFFESLTDGYVKMKVVHVSNATRLWVSLLEHTSHKDYRTTLGLHNNVSYKKLSLELTQYYSIHENRAFQVNPHEGSYCAYQTDDGLYFRVQVLKFSRPLGFYFPHKERANIRLIDVGIMETVEVSQLLVLPKYFMKLPPQVVEVYICMIKPKDKDSDWPREAVDCARRLMHGQILEGLVTHIFNRTLWLDRVEVKKVLKGIHLSTPLYNIVQELTKYQLADSNPVHLDSIREILHSDFHKFFSELNLSPGNELQVVVTAVDSQSLFYTQAVKSEESLSRLEEVLNTNTVFEHHSTFNVGDLCIAQFPHDSRWYRGQVIGFDRSICKYEVFFVDYGDAEWLDYCSVKPIHSSLAEYSFQAIECSLEYGEHEEFDQESKLGDVLWKITRNKVYLMKIVSVSESHVEPSAKCHSVTLNDFNSGSNVAEMLRHFYDSSNSSNVESTTSGKVLEHLQSPRVELSSEISEGPETDLPQAELVGEKSLSQLIELIGNSSNDLDEVLEEMQSRIISGFSCTITISELEKLAMLLVKILGQAPLVLSLVRILAGLVMMHCVHFNSLSMEFVLETLKSKSFEVVDLTLVLAKLALTDVDFEDVTPVVSLLCYCLRQWKSNRVILDHILDIFLLLSLNENNRLLVFHECWLLVTDPKTSESFRRILLEFLSIISRDMEVKMVLSCLKDHHECLDSQVVFHLLSNMKQTDDTSCLCAHKIKDPLLESVWNVFGETTHMSKQRLKKKHLHTSSESNDSKLCPKVLWTQEEAHIILAVQLSGCSQAKVQINGNTVLFRAVVSTIKYEFILILYELVAAEEFSVKYLMSEVLIKLNKAAKCEWPRLTETQEKLYFVNYDISRWTETEYTGFSESACKSGYTVLQPEDIGHENFQECIDDVEDESDEDVIGDMRFLCDDTHDIV